MNYRIKEFQLFMFHYPNKTQCSIHTKVSTRSRSEGQKKREKKGMQLQTYRVELYPGC